MTPEPQPNGEPIIKIGRKGRKVFAIGDGKPVTLDVVAVNNQWAEIDRSLRDEQGNLPPEHHQALNAHALDFAKTIFETEDVSLAEAWEFLKLIAQETKRLRSFFALDTPDEPSSAGSTKVTYSQ